ncbi:MAG: sigma 54-interacting transcriptional regulator [Desulfobacterales bacterium]|nr:sigma 54-interacting transcriptional regulator [Desulfobacterales bacterium]
MKKNNTVNELYDSSTEIILESISDGVFTVDHNWKIMSFNRAGEEITGISRDEAIGRHCWEVFRSNMCEGDCALKRTMKEGKAFVSTSTYIVNSEKRRIPITVSTSLLKNKDGKIIGGVEVFRDHSLVEELRKALTDQYQISDMVSISPAMKELFKVLPQVSESDSTVLIEGETGTGKELLAKAIHNLSLRKENPFIAVNCGALPDTLLESELFGYKAGAFTHAVKDKPGLFSAAENGTILLDEIGDTSPAFQVKLLRVIEERSYQPLGGVKKIKANVRIIAATNKNLFEMVEKGDFRRDLFYRINVIQHKLPPLRDRMEDIPFLVERFIDKLNTVRGKSVEGIDQDLLEILMAHDFPGNIRELENIIERAFVLCSEGYIQKKHLPGNLFPRSNVERDSFTVDNPVKKAEAKAIMDALKKHNFNRKAAAAELGIHKSTLFRKINRLGIQLPDIDGRSIQS